MSRGSGSAAIGDCQRVRHCGLWLGYIDKAVGCGEGADSWTNSDSYARSGTVCNGPSKSDHLITANLNGSWICGERIYLRSRAGKDRNGDGLFDIASSVGTNGREAISSRGVR